MDTQKIKVLVRLLVLEMSPYTRPLSPFWRFRGKNRRITDTTEIENSAFQKLELGLLICQGNIILDLS